MNLSKFLIIALYALLAVPSGFAFSSPQESATPQEEHRARFSQPDADAGMLAISAAELIKAGDQDWLRARLFDTDVSEAGIQAILSAFTANKEIAALPEILKLSVTDQRPEVLKSCSRAIQFFLEDPESRAATIERLIELCADPSEDTVLASIQNLGEADELSALDTLIPFTAHKTARIRASAVHSLRSLTYQNFGEDAAQWSAWWNKNRHLSRDRLIEPIFIRDLEESRETAQQLETQRNELALQIVEGNPGRAIDFLTWDVPAIRRRAAEVIYQGGEQEGMQATVQKVIAHLEQGEDDEETLKYLLRFIGLDPNKNPAALAILLRVLQEDPRDTVKVAAANGLHRFKRDEVRKAVLALLDSLLNEMNRGELKEALLDLLAIQGCQDALNLIGHYLGSNTESSKGVREKAARALGASGEPRAIDMLGDALKGEPESNIRAEIASSLLDLGKLERADIEPSMKERAAAALERGLLDRESRVKIACINGIGELKPANGLAVLREHLLRSEEDPAVRLWYIKAIGWIGDPEGLEVIGNALSENKNSAPEDVLVAVNNICGEDLELWIRAVEIFYARNRFDLTINCCDNFISRAKGTNGDDATLRKVKIRRAESYFARYSAEGNLEKALEPARELAEQLAPENNFHKLSFAKTLARLGRHTEAAKVYKQLLARMKEEEPEFVWRVKLEQGETQLALANPQAALNGLAGRNAPEFAALPEALRTRIADLVARATAALEAGKPATEKSPPEQPGAETGEEAGKGQAAEKPAVPAPETTPSADQETGAADEEKPSEKPEAGDGGTPCVPG